MKNLTGFNTKHTMEGQFGVFVQIIQTNGLVQLCLRGYRAGVTCIEKSPCIHKAGFNSHSDEDAYDTSNIFFSHSTFIFSPLKLTNLPHQAT